MNLFITGAGGFIGRQLLMQIAEDKHFDKIYCLNRGDSDFPSPFITVHGSLENLSSLPAIDADICIHLAAITNSAPENADNVFSANTIGTANVIEFCKKSNIPHIVFLSSVNVYLSRRYAYGESKLLAEDYIKNSGLSYTILRAAFVYGANSETFDKIVYFAKKFHIVPVLGNGKAYKQPIYVDEACDAIINYALYHTNNTTIDLLGKEKMTYNEMVKKLINTVGCCAILIHLPKKPFYKISEFCYNRKIKFPLLPEQISHMCENLYNDKAAQELSKKIELSSFKENLQKYIKQK